MTFGSRLAEARKRKQLTQEGLGKGLGTDGKDASKAVVYGWEKDQHHPRADQLAMICERLDCSADYLLFGTVTESELSKDVAGIAAEVESLPPKQREVALTIIRQGLALVRETLSHGAESRERNTALDADQEIPSPKRMNSR